MGWKCVVLLVIAAVFGGGVGWAEDPLLGSVDALVKAYEAGDAAAFETAVAGAKASSVWVYAGELLKQGRHDVALRLARQSKDLDAKRLAAFLEKTKDEPLDPAGLKATAAADAAFAKRDLVSALQALDTVEPKGLVGVWVLNGRGMAQRFLQRPVEAEKTYDKLAAHARALGWLDKASESYDMARQLARYRGDLVRAIHFAKKQLQIQREIGSKAGIAAGLINVGGRYMALGRYDEGLPFLKEGIDLAREIGHADYLANGLANLGRILARQGDPDEAQRVLEDALTRMEVLGDPRRAANVKSSLALLAQRRFQYDRALALYEDVRKTRQQAGDARGLAVSHLTLSGLQHRLGRAADALASARAALAIVQTMPNAMGRGDARVALAKALQISGQSDAALDELEKANKLYLLANHTPGLIETALVRSDIHQYRGAYRKALHFAEEARREAGTTQNRTQILAAEMLRAAALLRLGDLDEALAGYERVRDGHAERGPSPDLAQAWANIGTIRLARREPTEALVATETALDLYRRFGDSARMIEVGSNVGAAWMQLGNPEKALRAFEAAAEAAATSSPPDVRVNAILSLVGARAALDGGDPESYLAEIEAARVLAERSSLKAREVETRIFAASMLAYADRKQEARDAYRAAREAAHTLGHEGLVCAALVGEADAELTLGQPDAALARCTELQALAEQRSDEIHLANAARIRAKAHLQRKAWKDASDAANLAADVLGDAMRGIPKSLGVAAPDVWQEILQHGIDAAVRLKDPARLFHILERARAGQLLEALGGRDALRGAAVPEALADQERQARAAVVEARDALARVGGRLKEARAARSALVDAQTAYADVIGRIQLQARHGTRIAFPAVPELTALQKALGKGDAYACLAAGTRTLVALVVTRDAARVVDLGDPGPLEDALDAVEAGDADEPVDEAMAALTAFLVKPLALPADTKRVLLSPSDRLVFVPFQALMPKQTVLYVPAARALLATEDTVAGEGVLGLGDPAYGTELRASRTRGPRLSPLPATRAEVERISDVALLGKAATEAGLRRALPKRARWRAVHLACHGLIDDEQPMASSLALAKDPHHDGYLGVAEIYRMAIPADVVVLSACESGRGRLAGAQGVVGFMGAFFFAGADAVITSLWKVDDEATSALMTKLYELWRPKEGKGLPLADALRRAQEHVAAQPKWKHLAYWGAWQLWTIRR